MSNPNFEYFDTLNEQQLHEKLQELYHFARFYEEEDDYKKHKDDIKYIHEAMIYIDILIDKRINDELNMN